MSDSIIQKVPGLSSYKRPKFMVNIFHLDINHRFIIKEASILNPLVIKEVIHGGLKAIGGIEGEIKYLCPSCGKFVHFTYNRIMCGMGGLIFGHHDEYECDFCGYKFEKTETDGLKEYFDSLFLSQWLQDPIDKIDALFFLRGSQVNIRLGFEDKAYNPFFCRDKKWIADIRKRLGLKIKQHRIKEQQVRDKIYDIFFNDSAPECKQLHLKGRILDDNIYCISFSQFYNKNEEALDWFIKSSKSTLEERFYQTKEHEDIHVNIYDLGLLFKESGVFAGLFEDEDLSQEIIIWKFADQLLEVGDYPQYIVDNNYMAVLYYKKHSEDKSYIIVDYKNHLFFMNKINNEYLLIKILKYSAFR